MTKQGLTIAAIVVISAISAIVAYLVLSSSRLSPHGTATHSYNGLDIRVDYFRPSKRGRVIFGEAKDGALQPYGKYWRLGANDATEITLSKDVIFGGKPLKAGRYRMYAVPNELSWMISLNSELGKWGANEPNYSLDILKVEVPVERTDAETEQFTISLNRDPAGAIMNMAWDKAHVRVPIVVQ